MPSSQLTSPRLFFHSSRPRSRGVVSQLCSMLARMRLARCSLPPMAAHHARNLASGLPPRRYSLDDDVSDYSGVLAALGHYITALHHKDTAQMAEVWHERCVARQPSGDGGVQCTDARAFMESISSSSETDRGAPELPLLADRVVAVDFASPETAMAKVEITVNASTYTNYLALLRLASGWKIVAKLFAGRPATASACVDTTPHESAAAELGSTVSSYFAARRNADAQLMGALLHPSCQLFGARRDNGSLCEVERELFVGRSGSAHQQTPAGVGPSKWDRLVSLDKSGPDTALAKLHIGYYVKDLAIDPSAPPGDRIFTDYLHLIRVAGGWRIVARIYSAIDAF